VSALPKALSEIGWIDGLNFRLDIRYVGASLDLARTLASEIVTLRPDVIVASGTATVAALLRVTRTIPIVFVSVSDPIGEGFLTSFASPGRNITGFTNFEPAMCGKWVELLREISPNLHHVGFLFDPMTTAGRGSYFLSALDIATRTVGMQPTSLPAHEAAEFGAIFSKFARKQGAGLIVVPSSFTVANAEPIIAQASESRLPTIYSFPEFVRAGGLISYGVDLSYLWSRAASYVDRILNGHNAGDLPVQAPSQFQLTLNVRTASILGLTIPPSLLARADEVIE